MQRAAPSALCAKVAAAAGFIKACVAVFVCVWLWLCVCSSMYVCVCASVRVIVEAFAVAAFLDTTFGFFSAAADPVGALWAVWTVGVAGCALWHILILLCAAENANFSLHFVGFPQFAHPLSLSLTSPLLCVCVWQICNFEFLAATRSSFVATQSIYMAGRTEGLKKHPEKCY